MKRIVVAAAILFSGLALVPSVPLLSQHLDWQMYAGVYQPQPHVYLPLISFNH